MEIRLTAHPFCTFDVHAAAMLKEIPTKKRKKESLLLRIPGTPVSVRPLPGSTDYLHCTVRTVRTSVLYNGQ